LPRVSIHYQFDSFLNFVHRNSLVW
jgi:hypothetical protein